MELIQKIKNINSFSKTGDFYKNKNITIKELCNIFDIKEEDFKKWAEDKKGDLFYLFAEYQEEKNYIKFFGKRNPYKEAYYFLVQYLEKFDNQTQEEIENKLKEIFYNKESK